ncbi:hypothetical protein BGX34_003737 [Mortierella sp. NVP85]|nr:hypothetical protein BGX34_003737 [Mortierella sp. NVP85]
MVISHQDNARKRRKTGGDKRDHNNQQQDDHQGDRQNRFHFEASGCFLTFQRISTKDLKMRYLCRCNSTFSSAYAVRAHVKGVQAKSRHQDPCTIMAVLLAFMVDKQYEYQEQVEYQMAYSIKSKRLLPEGIRLKVNIEEDLSPEHNEAVEDEAVDDEAVDDEK